MVSSAPQAQSQPPSAEEEALKRNTDCVYFLASPLTCKKGGECEYRHSDIARVNPRDCWFWLHSSCLNPKCGFRHPPLDGLLGTQMPTSSAPSSSMPQTVTTPTPHVPSTSTKQGVPCIFFQKGYCLKGDWCPFLHVPNSLNNKPSPVPGTASAAEPATTIKKAFSGLEKSVQEKKVPPINVAKPVKDSPQAKPIVEVEPPLPRNEFTVNRRVPPTSGITEFPGYRSAPPVSNGNPVSWSSRLQQPQQPHQLDEPESTNGKDAEEISREPSPGFDVLVDDEGRDSEYYPGEDRYGISREHEAGNEYDISHSADYNTIAAIDDERYQDPLGYEPHEHRKGEYAWEQHRASSGRISGGSYLERRPYARSESLGQVDKLDLRHRLAKHKKPNGLRSVISHEHARDSQVGDRGYQGLRRDEQHVSLHENSLGSRLRGRIRLPRRSSSPADRDVIRGTDRVRLSPVRASIPSHQGRIRDRIKGRVEEASNNVGKNHRGLHLRIDVGDNSADFAGPKSLAELKNRKNAEPSRQHVTDQQSLGKRKHLMLDGQQQSGNDLTFEGPKPLEEILKRKRGGTIGALSGRNPSNNEGVIEGKNQKEAKNATNNKTTAAGNTKEVYKSTSVHKIGEDESKPAPSNSEQPVARKLQAEDGMLIEDGADPEAEAYEPKDGESDYEQATGEDFDLYDGENGDAEGEYLDDDDDDDDFAKKMGVMYS
uniref:AtC3H17-like protein n=1 Tax=Catalpa bungei TaxID=265496 RepID=A0A142CCZ8_9LAMI|nr:AtC3H17-like protein [Catalpa bungei]